MSDQLTIVPKGYRVLVKRDPIEETSAGGIVLVEDKRVAQAATTSGTVVAIGDLAWKGFKEGEGTPWASVGDRVYFAQYAGANITDPVTEEKYVIMNDDDIIAVLKEDAA